MVTVEWVGTFQSEGRKPHISVLSFTDYSLDLIVKQITEFVECMEDGGWVLVFNETKKIHYEN